MALFVLFWVLKEGFHAAFGNNLPWGHVFRQLRLEKIEHETVAQDLLDQAHRNLIPKRLNDPNI